ncbi:VWA domain-containing protein [Marinobacter salinisoli]|uniref:VWA domain-containing protein n=1 Tax=Marinobacter salinisoli TaxID=2769486 RepID=A0ABX7MTU6_9GAMM|nr:VWA domain-containing protein [Marinobacter salinisoli]QSP94799.1 VWA domain-containing protein [Marinobacter salinisoli]
MSDKELRTKSDKQSIDQFIQQVRNLPKPAAGGSPGRLIFALDATASREATWDQACHLQSELFLATRDLGGLAIQLCYYRGFSEFKATGFVAETGQLLDLMNGVACRGGRTQIARLLAHVLKETRAEPVRAVVFIGDCCEEPVDDLCHSAGELGLLKTPVFMFHEGSDPHARAVFQQVSKLSGGAYAPFDRNSPQVLKDLMAAVAVYASGGAKALQDFSSRSSAEVRRLTRQIR